MRHNKILALSFEFQVTRIFSAKFLTSVIRQKVRDNLILKTHSSTWIAIVQPVHPKGDQSWVFFGRKLKLQYFDHLIFKELTHLKWPRCWERLEVGGEGDNRGWDGWMASLTQWTWVWVNSGRWWWTGRFGVLQFMGPQSVRRDWVTEVNWTTFFSLEF